MHNRSYDAGEENAISFHKGGRTVEIEAISEVWWQGERAEGLVGQFPGTFQPSRRSTNNWSKKLKIRS